MSVDSARRSVPGRPLSTGFFTPVDNPKTPGPRAVGALTFGRKAPLSHRIMRHSNPFYPQSWSPLAHPRIPVKSAPARALG